MSKTQANLTTRAASFSLALMVTLSMLGGVGRLASPERVLAGQAIDTSAEQVVTITAERLARS